MATKGIWSKLSITEVVLSIFEDTAEKFVIMNFLNNRTNTWIWRQAFASLQHGFLRSEENVVLNNFETSKGVWENVVSCNILTLNFYKTII